MPMKRSPGLYIAAVTVVALAQFLAGCSTVVYERKKDASNPADEGVETSLKLQGPKAVMKTQF